MANVTVWKFDSPGGAAGAGARLDTLAKEGAGRIVDGAVVEWAESQRTPRLTVLYRGSADGALGRKFWHWLFEAVQTAPTDQPVGSAPTDIAESLAQAGLDDESIGGLRAEITKGSSALFLVAEGGNLDRILEAFGGASRYVHLIHSNLPADQEATLRATFTTS